MKKNKWESGKEALRYAPLHALCMIEDHSLRYPLKMQMGSAIRGRILLARVARVSELLAEELKGG